MPSRTMTLFLGISLAVIFCWLLQILKFVFLPLVIAVFISFLLTPMVQRLAWLKIPYVLSVIITLAVSLTLLYLSGTVVLRSLVTFQGDFPQYEAQINDMVSKAERLSNLDLGPIDNDRLREELSRLSLSSIVGSTLNSFFSLMTHLLFTLVFTIYFLLGRRKLPDKIRRAFPPEQARAVNVAVNSISIQVQHYIWAKTLTSLITGAMMILVCILFGIDFPITWGFFAFLLNFIPTIGVFIACIPPPFVALVQTGSWAMALWVVAVLFVVMMTLGNIVEPRILGDSVNLSPLAALFSLIFWGWLWGPAGMIVAVPITAMIKFTCDHVQALRPIGVLMGGES